MLSRRLRGISAARWLLVLITIFILLSGSAAAQTIALKAAQVSGVTGQWASVSFGQTIATPIVMAGPLSYADTQPAGVRVRNVTATGFEVQAQEWDSQDGVHGAEQLSYVALAAGRYTLGNGKVVLAASTSVTGGSFQSKTFSQPFATVPVILATVVTQNEVSAVAVQMQNITTSGFQIRLREQEANAQSHVAETVHYLAWEPGSGTINGLAFQVGSRTADHNFATVTFSPAFASIPAFVAGTQTVAGAEAYSLRYQGLATGSVQVRLQEDNSLDAEFFHVLETVGYVAIATGGGSGNQAPNGVIDTPTEAGTPDVTITVGQSVNFTGTGTDPENSPLTYLWDFGSAGIAQSTVQDPGAKVFNTAGTFTVTFTVTDSSGLADPTPATRTIQVNAATNQVDCTQPPDQGTPACIGQWTPPFKWGTTNPSEQGTVAVHLNVLPNGKVFGWSRGGAAGGGNNGIEPVVTWDPTTNQYIEGPPMDDLFCSGHAQLPDGRLLVSGGALAGAAVATPYDWRTGVWGTSVRMNNNRFYPSVLPLANGEQLVIAGGAGKNAAGQNIEDMIPQVWTLNDTFRDLTGANFKLPQYPWVFLAPDNRVFIAGPMYNSYWLTTTGAGSIINTGLKHQTGNGWFRDRTAGSAVMYRPGKILIAGGAAVDKTTTPYQALVTNTAEIIDLNVTPPVWQKAGTMVAPSVDHMLILLPDGNVFKVGGTTAMVVTPEGWLGNDADETKAILTPQIWSPSLMSWRSVASMQVPRKYHSTGVLLPDGRVLVAGGGKIAGFVDHRDAQIYSPPYLFMGPRPTINGIVSQRGNDIVQYGESFTVVTSNTDVTRVTLTRLPSMSHSLDWNQRFDELSNVVKVAGGYQVTAPPNKNVCPPGYYYLHLLNNKGVPSVARIIQIPVS